jgi:hypothetical protein
MEMGSAAFAIAMAWSAKSLKSRSLEHGPEIVPVNLSQLDVPFDRLGLAIGSHPCEVSGGMDPRSSLEL